MTSRIGAHVSTQIAARIVEGFDRHYALFRACSQQARRAFEEANWHQSQALTRERIAFYDTRVDETVAAVEREFGERTLDETAWRAVKLATIAALTDHKQPELAETFFNSVICKLLHRSYFNNDFIFWRPAVSVDMIESDPPTYRSYYPATSGLTQAFARVLTDMQWATPFEDLPRDCGLIVRALANFWAPNARFVPTPQISQAAQTDFEPIFQSKQQKLAQELDVFEPQPNFQLQILGNPFYRNKAAYIVGKLINGHREVPFALPVLHSAHHQLFVDAMIVDVARISQLFSLNRAYFLVDMEVPSAYVQFLRTIMPTKPKSELYTMLGLQKQGKTMFYRDLIAHLRHSNDQFIVAPGIRGMVMAVFTLPSFPYVFKIIKDHFAPPKDSDRATVKKKYLLVKQHDRVGRMADTLEFSNVALPKHRFAPELIAELKAVAASTVSEEGGDIVLAHVYIERRMEPLNLYLDRVDEARADAAIQEYGNAIRELAAANIFPGDMLYKNFGVTRFDRVVFYDYDEIEYVTDCHFRVIPPAPNEEAEMSGEPWYSVRRNDVFPEEFAAFLLANPRTRSLFLKHHGDLLTAQFWQARQESIRAGKLEDFYPYPQEMRFRPKR